MYFTFHIKRTILLLLSALFGLLNAHAQGSAAEEANVPDLAFEEFQLPGEATGNSVQSIVQDPLGFLWFGSQSGLHRYDGKNFITYNSDPINQNTLNSDYIEGILIDRKGIMWLTHWGGGGLTAYDPGLEEFTRYNHDPEDPESILPGETGAIVEDAEGFIWVGGRQGLSRLDPATGKFKRYSHDPDDPTSLSDNEIGMLYVDTTGTLWVSTGMPWSLNGRGGLNRFDSETDSFERYLHDPNDPTTLTNNKVRTLYEDSKGNFWVGTAGDGLHRFDQDNKTFTHYPYDPEHPDRPSMPFVEGTDLETAVPWSHISSIFEDNKGRLWIAAVYSGLNVYDPGLGITRHYEAREGEDELGSNFVWKIYQSDDGTIWVSTGGEGKMVYKVKENRFRFPFFHFEELEDPQMVTRGIIKDSTGAIWMAQSRPSPNSQPHRSKVWKINEGGTRPSLVRLNPDLSSSELSSFLGSISLDKSGNIWAGTFDGYRVGDLEEKNFENFVPDVGAPDDLPWVAPVLQSSTGAIWIPYWGRGLIRYEPENKTFEVFEYDPEDPRSISGVQIWALYEDSNGDIWAGGGSFTPSSDTPLFLDRYDPETNTFEPFLTTILPYGITSHITEDDNGNLWFSDGNFGLYKLNPATRDLKKFTSSNSSLPGTRISSIIQYPGGNIWIATDYELVELDPVNETFSIYDELHGIVPVTGTLTGHMSWDGDLLFARWEGYHAFNPGELLGEIKSNLPDLRITGFKLLDDSMYGSVTGQSEQVLEEPIWKTELIELDNTQNTFAFSVACFDFYQPGANTIQFMLEGYDRGWRSDIRNGDTPFYVNIAPGTYTFRLRGANGLGVWNTEGISMDIIVNPPWWKTWWAYTMYLIVFIGGVYGIHKIQRRRLILQERARSQQKELEQAREIEKAYEQLKATQEQLILSEKMASLGELTAGIAHEIQNPLNFVNNFSEVSSELVDEMNEELDKGDIPEAKAIAGDLKQNLEKINHHGRRADSIVKGMLQHSRGSEGKKEPTDLNALADEYLRLAYHGLRAKDKTFNATMETDFDEKLPKVRVVPQDIGRVLLNLLTNAFYAVNEKNKSAPESYVPTVRVASRKTPKGVEIEVSDNGNGMPKKVLDKIFQPFFTTKPAGQGTGLGLSMSYDIVKKAHDGELKVASREGDGTSFTVILPMPDKTKTPKKQSR
ncbi:two-component regulator propeller domain-containing protein [Robiginitalea sp. SC105]|uniref:sensor histidine kinase n=1 Tax=Robiginitalea sp. SC105 TaxID=2762332 RepID=UPI00163A2427|nr:two-component regulator propeller domain-containing protein [Robiginitalea sp. SC105]MBC2839779.1 hypothetical protein [Robiginitalea sp. SC105]